MSTPPPSLRSQRDSGPARTPAARGSAAALRHAPYARPAQHTTPRARSFADCLLGICEQLSKPLFGQSPGRSSGDAFSVPWRVVDRETSELHAELLQAQQEAAVATLDKKQPLAAETAAGSPSPLPPPSSEEKTASAPPYESVFDAARRIAEHRAADAEHPAVDSAEEVGAVLAPKAAPGNDEDEDEDADYTPDDAANDDEEEEILQSEIEPICEQEEITALPASGSTSSSAAPATQRAAGPSVSRIAEFFEQRGASSHADNNLTDMSVEETSSSDDDEAARQESAQPQAPDSDDADLSVSSSESEPE
ncbi:hypothetical protein IWQ57_002974, partial [Coemansia nantahalensis]